MQYQQTLAVINVFVRFCQIWENFSKQLWPQNRLQRQKEGPKAKIGVTRPKMVSHLENIIFQRGGSVYLICGGAQLGAVLVCIIAITIGIISCCYFH